MVGVLVNGCWTSEEYAHIEHGAFIRQASVFDAFPDAHIVSAMQDNSRRYCLVASLSCPWSHRVLLVRTIKQLEEQLPFALAGEPRIEGYALQEVTPLCLVDPSILNHVHQLYTRSDTHYTGRVTVPLLWDVQRQRIASNDSAQLMRILDGIETPFGFTLFPQHRRAEMHALNLLIHRQLSNAVYRAGFAQRQEAYDCAVDEVFATLQLLDERLCRQRYLFGNILTESDLRLFATLVRFDAVYATHFRCTRHRLVEYANLWAYARDILCWHGVSDTVDFDVIMRGYNHNYGDTKTHRINAKSPEVDWWQKHLRDQLGPAQIWFPDVGAVTVEPTTLAACRT
jgi:putative glutathione S-transferase